jgi:hypothetical protein
MKSHNAKKLTARLLPMKLCGRVSKPKAECSKSLQRTHQQRRSSPMPKLVSYDLIVSGCMGLCL